MKNQKGVTLISLIVYIIVFTIVITVVANITRFFYSSMKDSNVELDPISEYITFNTYFSDEVNHEGIEILECTENYIIFSNGVQYTYASENKGIYRNKVKICKNIDTCTFSTQIENGKQIINVEFGSGNVSKTPKYTLKN